MTHARRSLIIVAAAGLLLSACGSETSGSPTPAETTTAAETTSSTTSKPSSTSNAPIAAGGEVTAPGSKLKVGSRAVIPFTLGDKSGTVAVTLTAIEQGAKEDLAKFGDKAKGITPFYLRVKVENLSGTDLRYISISLRGLGADGKGTGVIISGDTPNCDSTSAPKTFTAAGETYETCVLTAATDGSKVVAGEYNRGDDYVKSPIVWES
ncbi:hypothetical protein AB0A63_02305 [Lentzea sp. NPDC042327]|uniref:hypothetical protein n=1 Tax=Lentzea sp. NPDC042327 TaxID=3154801 RepID=UPI00340B24DD